MRVLGVSGVIAALIGGGGGYPSPMLMASIFGLAFILSLALTMHIPTKALAELSPLPPLTTNLLFGLVTLICTLWVTFLFNFTIHKSLLVWVVALALINVVSILYLRANWNQKLIKYGFSIRDFLVVVSASALSIFPQTGFSIKAGLRSRIGPDMIGWVSSGQYLYDHSNLNNLKDLIKSGLNIQDISQVFNDNQKILKHHVYNLLSYTDQVHAEFLIGAKRIIGPRIFSSAFVVLGRYNTPLVVTTVSFIFITIGLIFVIDNLGHFKNFSYREFPALISLILITCNFAYLNPINEGGLGQIFIMPAISLLIAAYLKNIFKLESIILFLLSAKILYPEGGSQMLLIVTLILLFDNVFSKLRYVTKKERFYLILLISWIILALGSWATEILNLAKTLSKGGGGWGIGNVISPFNFGFINYVDRTGKFSPNQYLPTFLFLCSIFTVLVLNRNSLKIRSIYLSRVSKLLLSVGLTWLCIFYLSWGTGNNYSVWKFASTASLIIFIVGFNKAKYYFMVENHKNFKIAFISFILLIALPLSETIQYYSQWMSGSEKLIQLTMSKNDLISIEKLLDKSVVIKFGNFAHTNTLELLGNLRWPERGSNIISPGNELNKLLIVESSYCKPYESAKEVLLLTRDLCFLNAASSSIKL